MEYLLALAELHAIQEHFPGDFKLDVRDLFIVYGHTAACHVLPGIAVGGCQTAGHHQAQKADFSVGQLLLRQLGGGKVRVIAVAGEQGLGGGLGLQGLLLAVNQQIGRGYKGTGRCSCTVQLRKCSRYADSRDFR